MTMVAEQRIAVIGSPGAGKSTLATALAQVTGLPNHHLDREYWRPGWVERDAADWQAINAGLVTRPNWIIDGNYGSSLGARLDRATLVIWLDLPTRVCVAGVLRRLVRFRERARPDMGDGCPERLNRAFLQFLHYVLVFHRRKAPEIARALANRDVPVVRLRSAAARARFGRVLAARGLPAAMAAPGC